MEPKLILPALGALGAAFFFLAGDGKFALPDMGGLLGVSNMGGGDWNASAAAKSPVFPDEGGPVPMGQLVDGLDASTISGPPGEIQLVALTADCAVTPPVSGQRVAPIMAEPSEVLTQIYSYDDDEIARSAAYEIDRVLTRGGKVLSGLKKLDVDPMYELALDLVTVIVPPGPEPVYLVLKDQSAGIVWNILPMPGATVAHVTLLATGSSGVVNLPEGAILEVPDLGSGACGAFHRVIEAPAVTENAGFVPSDETRAAWAAYSGWFGDTFGVAADAGLTGRSRATAVLAGLAPPEGAPKAVWQGVAGKVVRLMPADITYAADAKQHKEWFIAKATAEITSAFGAPEGSDVLALLKPVLHERSN